MMDALRAECRHTHFMELDGDTIDPVRAFLAELGELEKALQKTKDNGVDNGSVKKAGSFDFKACNGAKAKLKKSLTKLSKR